ncbi:hypothetical protein CDG77_20060 [Nostoc sp. 'Peltigera membranacea cyanobiont' 213]|uniref:hypothetical protein n=1 Tax=Nostoc sp. 'Peltigera membranacea cyanobiont' 213 TaxID=2014530 RepID=UPI000B95ACEB|nr:hypothetical protein [Nostoc sp. 'Peltigera membranacea cyanobiont' 213]OYD89142.1 hypothetical protein CDG77_20060 [Nostoc sp. 'Peltigera membranacea cyanobiont' 213]
MKIQKMTHKSSLPSNTRNKLVLRRTRKRFNPRIFIERTIETTAIISLLLTGFSGVGAMACWGLEIIETNNPNIIISGWEQQKNICLGAMLVNFSVFLGSSLVGASFSIKRDKF